MKMSQIYRIFAIATFVLSTNCTTDGDVSDDGLAAADAGNQVVTAAPEEVSDSEIPNPEQVASEAAQAQEGEPQKPKDSAELVDPGRAAGMQELTSDQQLNGSTELPSESINESNDTYNLAKDNKAVQNLIDDTKQTGHNDPLPPLEHVVAEAEQPSPIAKKSLKPNKIDNPEIALAAESTEVSATDDSISVDSPKSTKSSKKHAIKKTKVQPKSGLSDIVPANTYIVQPGDTLGKISTILYGSSGHWRELAQANNLSAQS
ncbi:MAG: LysM domain-containing protein, partial [Proteobacteria bacterium]|nr:LysM domain-containing protein [Pseudomonadota bacterium]